jgi:hypothetical protein
MILLSYLLRNLLKEVKIKLNLKLTSKDYLFSLNRNQNILFNSGITLYQFNCGK